MTRAPTASALVAKLERELEEARKVAERQREADAKQVDEAAALQQRAAELCSHRAARQTSLDVAAALSDLAKSMRERAVVR